MLPVMKLSEALRAQCVNTIRMLSADGVERAKSGHPGTPMGAADVAFVLWTEFLRHDPAAPTWINRDRFVLSGGHASMQLYSLLHLSGYDLPLDELKRFRQWGSKTPGHPEYGHTAGVEITTGPLGAGFAGAVGMALAAKMLAARFNRVGVPLIDTHVYGICGDGDMQEGVTSEAASLAGHLGLGNLVFVYDNNDITIEGHLDISMGENVGRRFQSYGWHVEHIDGHNHDEIRGALERGRARTVEPTLIIAKTVIGRGAPTKAGTHEVHGAPLGADEMKRTRDAIGWPDETFYVPAPVREVFASVAARGKELHAKWDEMHAGWRAKEPDAARLWDEHFARTAPADLDERLVAAVGTTAAATRALSGKVIQAATAAMPWLIGGAADLEPSTNTGIKGAPSVVKASVKSDDLPDPSFAGRNLHFGIREHAMGWVANGMTLSGAWLTYTATFLVFSDYMRPPIRLAALMKIPTLFIFTHDSFWVGEDGPTHQPIEHLETLRAIPDLHVWRPADGLETAMAWSYCATRPDGERPNVMILTRQKTAVLERPTAFAKRDVWRGGYVVADAAGGAAEVVIVATGSEVGVAVDARAKLATSGVRVRVVSMPCLERFDAQPEAYRRDVLLEDHARICVVEAGRTTPWYRIAGKDGLVIGLDHFGASAPGEVLAEKFGMTGDAVAARVLKWLGRG